MNTKDTITYGAIALVAVVALMGLGRSEPINTVEEKVVEQVGAAPGPSLNSEVWEVNGVKHWYYKPSIVTSTTTPVTVKSPNATSTLMVGSGCHFTTSSTSAKAIRVAKALTPNATTTFLFGANSSASAPQTVISTTTTDNFVFGPNQYVNISMVGGTGVDSPAGSCVFEFMAVN